MITNQKTGTPVGALPLSSPAQNSAIKLRRATPEDAKVCGRICYEAFAAISSQHNFTRELPSSEDGMGLLEMLFSHPGFYCVVAESDGRIVGSNCLDERSAIPSVGPVTVAPDVQNRSIGRVLMQAVVDRARERGFPGVRLLQSTYHNRSLSLYTKLGFDAREPMSVMQGPPLKRTVDGCAVRVATKMISMQQTMFVTGCMATTGRANCVMASVRARRLSWSAMAGLRVTLRRSVTSDTR